MTSRIRSCLWLFGWVAFIHLLTSLLGFGLLALVFDPLGGGTGATMLCLCMVVPWFLCGRHVPYMARSGWKLDFLTLAIWAILTWTSYYLISQEGTIVHVIPQYLTGVGFAELWPGNHHTQWYFDVLEPVVMSVAHFLLPVMLGLGMLLPTSQTSK